MAFLGLASGIVALFFFFLYTLDLKSHGVEAIGKRMEEIEDDLELERQLQILNVPHPLKTIITKKGDILDCVDFYKQPALAHPLLKDHKIQVKPSVSPKWGANTTSSAGSFLVTFELEECPHGTVPIRRTSKEDLLRARTLSREFTTSFNNQSKRHFAGQFIADVNNEEFAPIHGASAFINVYNPNIVDRKQFSSAQIWINGGPNDNPNYIMAGWTVNPGLYGDKQTRLFTYWTGNNYKSGCYNTLCKGFVQVDKSFTPGLVIHPVSTIGGDQYEIQVSIFQDRGTGHWWFTFQNRKIGYWPKSLFNSLVDGAKGNSWGGIVNAGSNGVSPPMGSGAWPRQKYSCYFRKIEYMDRNYRVLHPIERKDVSIRVDNTKCYDLQYEYYGDDNPETHFWFGGPGGRCG